MLLVLQEMPLCKSRRAFSTLRVQSGGKIVDEKGFTVTCDNCIFGRHLGGNDWGCLSELRRMDKKRLVNNPVKEPFECEYSEYWRNEVRR